MKFLRFLKNVGKSTLSGLGIVGIVAAVIAVMMLVISGLGYIGHHYFHIPINQSDKDVIEHPYLCTGGLILSLIAVVGYCSYAIYSSIKGFCKWVKECWDEA